MGKPITKKKQVKQSNDISKTITELTVLPDSNSHLDKLDKQKRDFVLLYTKLNGNISNTCIGIGINRQTYYNWLDHEDKTFALAIADAGSSLNDEMRELLIQQAANGEMSAIIFYLKSRHPDFKPQPTTLIQNNFTEFAKKELEEFAE
jgi:hypothetical protein